MDEIFDQDITLSGTKNRPVIAQMFTPIQIQQFIARDNEQRQILSADIAANTSCDQKLATNIEENKNFIKNNKHNKNVTGYSPIKKWN